MFIVSEASAEESDVDDDDDDGDEEEAESEELVATEEAKDFLANELPKYIKYDRLL